MKIFAILTTFILATTALAGNSGFVQEDPPNHIVSLDDVLIDGDKTPYVGHLTVDEANNSLTLRIYDDPCDSLKPADGKSRCLAMASLVVELSVPITDRSFPCGSKQLSGVKDLSAVQGLRTEIVYVNHSTRVCKDIVPSIIMVEATTFNPLDDKTTYYSLETKK